MFGPNHEPDEVALPVPRDGGGETLVDSDFPQGKRTGQNGIRLPSAVSPSAKKWVCPNWKVKFLFVLFLYLAYYSEGIPSEEAMLSLYCALTGHTLPLPNWTYFLGLVFFRVVVNIQVSC